VAWPVEAIGHVRILRTTGISGPLHLGLSGKCDSPLLLGELVVRSDGQCRVKISKRTRVVAAGTEDLATDVQDHNVARVERNRAVNIRHGAIEVAFAPIRITAVEEASPEIRIECDRPIEIDNSLIKRSHLDVDIAASHKSIGVIWPRCDRLVKIGNRLVPFFLCSPDGGAQEQRAEISRINRKRPVDVSQCIVAAPFLP
jgi:hypothetical protein